MLVLVSDLHLTDTAARSTFDAATFGRALAAVFREAAGEGSDEVKLVLLGDVFEILKSTRWLENDVRPWEPPTEQHRETVRQIVDGILAVNGDFFAELQAIRGAHSKVDVTYVIGNHDRPLNTSMGNGSRTAIRERLGLAGDDALFLEAYEDLDYSLLAQHGHHWDKSNRYRGNSIAIGDAIVIDIVARLPIIFGDYLGVAPDDPCLRFVHEIDDVIPQTPYHMAKWLAAGLDNLDSDASTRLNAALGQVAEELVQRVRPYESESPVAQWWVGALKRLALVIGPLRSALKLPSGANSPPPLSRNVAFDLDESYRLHHVDYQYTVYGHTHIPDFRSIATERGLRSYLNCGTWRRLQRAVDANLGSAERPYASMNVHAFVIIRHPGELRSGQPGYELRQSYYD